MRVCVQEHLFLVCELLRANLYEFQKYNKESGDEPYFTNARIQKIAKQVLRSLSFLHSLGLIHSDLKPENILIKSYSRWGGVEGQGMGGGRRERGGDFWVGRGGVGRGGWSRMGGSGEEGGGQGTLLY